MSLINQMLKDLEKRKAEGAAGEALPKTVHVADQMPARSGSTAAGIVVGVVLTAAIGGGVWWYLQRSARGTIPTPTSQALNPASEAMVRPNQNAVENGNPLPVGEGRVREKALDVSTALSQVSAPPATPTPLPEGEGLDSANSRPNLPTAKASPLKVKAGEPKSRTRKQRPKHAAQPRMERADSPGQAARGGGSLAEEHYRRAQRLLDTGDESGAQGEWEAALNAAPGHQAARRSLAKSYAASGQYRRAETLLNAVDPDPETARLKAQIYLKQGKTEQAETVLEPSADSEDDPYRLAVQGALRQKQGRYGEAADAYNRALRRQPAQSKWWLGLAISLEGQEHYQDAIAAYRRVLAAGAPSREVARYVESRIEALQGGR